MNRRILIGVTLAVLGSLAPTLDARAQVVVSVRGAHPVETIYASDFSPYNVGQQPGFLEITLQNGAPESQSVVLELAVSREAPSSALIFRGTTQPFTLDQPMLRLTNRDLATQDAEHAIVEYEIGSATDMLTQRIAESGRFPSGSYVFRVTVSTPQGMVLDEGELRLDLTNITRVELLSPGQPFGDPPPAVTSPTPRFVWSTDAGVTGDDGEYELRVVPVDDAGSAEEAMEGFAAWETTTTETSAVYPGSVSALALEPGTTYAWQVTRRIRTSGGEEVVESPIYSFRMSRATTASSTGVGAASDLGEARLLERLATALGLTADLDGYEPSGQVMVDGQPVPPQEMERLLRAVLDGDVSVESVTIR